MKDIRDQFVMASIICAWVVASVYLFIYHSDTAFGVWGTVCGTLTGLYHFLNIRDDKEKDAC